MVKKVVRPTCDKLLKSFLVLKASGKDNWFTSYGIHILSDSYN